jgi:hypothetical protein
MTGDVGHFQRIAFVENFQKHPGLPPTRIIAVNSLLSNRVIVQPLPKRFGLFG